MAPIRSAVISYFAALAGATVVLLLVSAPFRAEPPLIVGSYVALLVNFSLAFLLRKRHPLVSGALCSLGPLVLVTIMVWVRGGMANPAAIMSYATLVLVTGLVWSSTGTLILTILSSAILGYFTATGPASASYGRLQQWSELVFQLFIVWGIVRLTLRALSRSQMLALTHEKRFKDALEESPDAIVGLDGFGMIQLFNRRAVQLSGVEASVAKNKALTALNWLPKSVAQELGQSRASVSGATSHHRLEIEVGDECLLEATLSEVVQAKGAPMRLIALRDVSERRKAEQAREALDARLAHSQSIDALGRLAGGVAHDFNNLLTVVSGTTEMLLMEKGLSPSVQEDLHRIEGATGRAIKLTSQLLAFGRKQVLEPRVFAVNAVLRGLAPLLERLVPSSITTHFKLSPDAKNVRVDESRLEQVIVNLVSNAVDAMPNGGILTIKTRMVDGESLEELPFSEKALGPYAELSVIDTGAGMDEVAQARLFEPFFTTKRQGQGTGLGLATVHGIIAQSKGFIRVSSEVGKGSAFRVYLPQTNDAATTVSGAPEILRPSPFGGRVLLVEDQPEVGTTAKRMLETLGYVVESAGDGQEALANFADRIGEFQFLVSDVVMPHMNGPALAKRLLSQNPNLAVLFVSGYTERAIETDGELTPGVHYLAKPFNLRALALKLEELRAASLVENAKP